MVKHKKQKNSKKNHRQVAAAPAKIKESKYPFFTLRLRKWLGIIILCVIAVILFLSFFGRAGSGGFFLIKNLNILIGRTVFVLPVLLFLGAILIWKPQKKRVLAPVSLGVLLFIVGICGILTTTAPTRDQEGNPGGWLGYIVSWPFLKYFGVAASFVVFCAFCLMGVLILWEFVPKKNIFWGKAKGKERVLASQQDEKEKKSLKEENGKTKPKFEIKPIDIFPKKKETVVRHEGVEEDSRPVSGLSKGLGGEYKSPPLELFDITEEKPASGDINYNAAVLKKTLQNFGIEVEMSEVHIGPTVTQYTLKPAEGVKLSRITSLSNDLALALASHPIRIEAPIPGRSLVGIEVPNKVRARVHLGNLLALPQYQKAGPLSFALGKDVIGVPMYPDLEKMPHLLVAGATGTGKTICLNTLIVSLIFRNSPKVLRLILIDPKRVEFSIYSALPHLLAPVILNAQKAVNALNWLVGEMERRFDVLQELGARDIVSYNIALQEKSKRKEEGFETMPYIVLIIDELADLMASKGREVEASIVRLSQLARAVGIHLVVATQRPSVEVITGLIKANITSRVAFQVASQVDSRTILDVAGSEKLLGRGDMLFISNEFSRPKRIQGSLITPPEIKRVVKFIEKENAAEAKEIKIDDFQNLQESKQEINLDDDNSLEEPFYNEAKEIVINYGRASASLLQRRLKIGYARAARILDILEEQGVVGPADGAKPREVLIKKEGDKNGFQDAGEVEFE